MTPVTLAVDATDGGVRLVVRGASATACAARFRLEVAGGGNRVDQRGAVYLLPGEPQTLAQVAVSATGDWSVELTVELDGAEAYVIRRSASGGA